METGLGIVIGVVAGVLLALLFQKLRGSKPRVGATISSFDASCDASGAFVNIECTVQADPGCVIMGVLGYVYDDGTATPDDTPPVGATPEPGSGPDFVFSLPIAVSTSPQLAAAWPQWQCTTAGTGGPQSQSFGPCNGPPPPLPPMQQR